MPLFYILNLNFLSLLILSTLHIYNFTHLTYITSLTTFTLQNKFQTTHQNTVPQNHTKLNLILTITQSELLDKNTASISLTLLVTKIILILDYG